MTFSYAPPFGTGPAAETLAQTPVAVHRPAAHTAPAVIASPHSGRVYPPGFTAESRLETARLRKSEDAYVDCLFAGAPALGAPMLRALFPRVMVDPNRGPRELDPDMFTGPLPPEACEKSQRAAAGLGVIPKTAAGGEHIYAGKLDYETARRRIETFRTPYHTALCGLIDETLARFGVCLVIDAHSMPSPRKHADSDPPEIVLGDAHGTACAPEIVMAAERELTDMGFKTARNTPYAGGWTTRSYGRPETGVHVLQIEISRGLYLDENTVTPAAGIETMRAAVDRLLAALMRAACALPARAAAAE